MKKIFWMQAARIIAFCLIFIWLTQYLYQIFSWKDTAGDYCSTMDTFYELEDNRVDVLFLGSSHCYCSLDPAVLWENYGIAAYSMAISGQDLASSYYCLKEALKKQDIKIVCLEMFYTIQHGYQDRGNLYRNILTREYSKDYYDAVKSVGEGQDHQELLTKWPVIHTRYRELKKMDFVKDQAVYMGYRNEYKVQYQDTMPAYEGDEVVPIPKQAQEWLEKIEELAREENIQLCYFLSPYSMDEYHLKMHKYVEKRSAEEGIPYLNFLTLQNEIGLSGSTDFVDWGHTNAYGAKKISDYLGKYLVSNYDLPDRRNEEGYSLWDENAKARKQEDWNRELMEITQIQPFIRSLEKLEDYAIVFSASGEYVADGIDLGDCMESQSWMSKAYSNGETVVWNAGEIVAGLNQLQGLETVMIGEDSLAIVRVDGIDDIYLEGQKISKVKNGINIVVYDKCLKKVVRSVGFSAKKEYEIVQ